MSAAQTLEEFDRLAENGELTLDDFDLTTLTVEYPPENVSFTVDMPPAEVVELDALARREGKTRSRMVRDLVARAVAALL